VIDRFVMPIVVWVLVAVVFAAAGHLAFPFLTEALGTLSGVYPCEPGAEKVRNERREG
jgi:hypothetical protein